MQYPVPQFIEVEDKIFGPLTLKQFLVMVAGGLVSLFYWALFKAGVIFFLLAIPTMLIAVVIALGKFNGQPVLLALPVFLQFFLKPRYRVFQRMAEKTVVVHPTKEPKNLRTKELIETEPAGSRLKKLAYVLDQKAAEEERLIHSAKSDTNIRIHTNDTNRY